MSATDPKFVIFRDMKDGCRWRLSSAAGETIEYCEGGRSSHEECEQEVYGLKGDRYPYAKVRDATIG